ncbi:MAG: hypothetical protein C4531_13235 [Desulfurivibrio sp.]|nr:MAG: hypothetical protein C4531_13235 [Desulfurivibrio sp.]
MRAWSPLIPLLCCLLLPNNIFALPGSKDRLQAECRKCHEAFVEKDFTKRYIHQPFGERQCLTCHVKAKDSSSAEQTAPQQQSRSKTRWLSMSSATSDQHAFLLPAASPSGKIVIDVKAPGQSPFRQALALPAADTMAKAENDRTPPRISAIQAGIQQSILLDAVITWRTDEKANATVRYGITGLGQTIEEKYCYATDHKITLPGLQKGATYQVVITCQDIFGNSITSPVFAVSTAKISPAQQPAAANPGKSSDKIAIRSNFLSLNDNNVMLELTASQPVAIAIGTSDEEPDERLVLLKKSRQNPAMDEEHPPLANKKYSSMTICPSCHPGYNQQKSHPVNILPGDRMKIPPEYPTLPDGRISCMTCHIHHAANSEFRLIKASRKELCSGCHPDKF